MLELRQRSQWGLCQCRKLVCHHNAWMHILTEYWMNMCRVTCIIHAQSSFFCMFCAPCAHLQTSYWDTVHGFVAAALWRRLIYFGSYLCSCLVFCFFNIGNKVISKLPCQSHFITAVLISFFVYLGAVKQASKHIIYIVSHYKVILGKHYLSSSHAATLAFIFELFLPNLSPLLILLVSLFYFSAPWENVRVWAC